MLPFTFDAVEVIEKEKRGTRRRIGRSSSRRATPLGLRMRTPATIAVDVKNIAS